MQITVTKKFHFYAAHRNLEIGGKCANLHGHRYGLSITVKEPMNGSVSILFEDLQNKIQPLVEELDHSLLLDVHDPAGMALKRSMACEKIYAMDNPTSAENLALDLFKRVENAGLNITKLELQETDSSTVTVTK